MKVVTATEMQSIDKKTIKRYGVSAHVLMERAGFSVAARITELFEKKDVVILAGGGNNGGDGIVAARNLHNKGWNVKIIIMVGKSALSPDCRHQARIAGKMGVPIEFRKKVYGRDLYGAIVVDALFGTGLNKPVAPPVSSVIALLNRSGSEVVSVDIPSGISADTGRVLGQAVRADCTVTFGLPKRGHFLHPGAEFTGRLFVEDIGFPRKLLVSDSLMTQVIESEVVRLLIPQRLQSSHKGDYGHVLVLAGSRGKTGAALMTAYACLRSGAGMVTMGVPESLVNILMGRVTEEMILPLADTGEGVLSSRSYDQIMNFIREKADVLAAGPGLSSDKEVARLMRDIVKTVPVPAVLDADALNVLAGEINILKGAKAPLILTPHGGEMFRLLSGKNAGRNQTSRRNTMRAQTDNDRITSAYSFARTTGTYVVLKGAPTLISGPEGETFINPTGNPGMATAGSGDVLTGMIAALLGQGMNPLDAGILGVYLHGHAGDCAKSQKGMHSLVASDIIDNIPAAFISLGDHDQSDIP